MIPSHASLPLDEIERLMLATEYAEAAQWLHEYLCARREARFWK